MTKTLDKTGDSGTGTGKTPYEQVVSAILDTGGIGAGAVTGRRLNVEKFILRGGTPVFVEALPNGGVELYTPAINTNSLPDLLTWIRHTSSTAGLQADVR